MTSQQSSLADSVGAALAIDPDFDPTDVLLDEAAADLTPVEQTLPPPSADQNHLDSSVVEELTLRLPTSELVKIIKGALECGRRNLPFTESDLLRTMTFGSSAVPVRQPARGARSPRG